ncbi:MAG: hypothetical protein WC408_04930 [Candidatus Micrarchaeia archaeon]
MEKAFFGQRGKDEAAVKNRQNQLKIHEDFSNLVSSAPFKNVDVATLKKMATSAASNDFAKFSQTHKVKLPLGPLKSFHALVQAIDQSPSVRITNAHLLIHNERS